MKSSRVLIGLIWMLLAVIIITTCSATSHVVSSTCDASHQCNATSPLYVQDGFLGDDSALVDSLIQYLDSHEPTNQLGVVMVPIAGGLFEKFKATLASLGAPSSNPGRFPQLQTAAFSGGSGVFPGKVAATASKECHSDYEVDSDFGVDNVVGPTAGRVGILYLSGDGDFLLVDKATGEETHEELTPGPKTCSAPQDCTTSPNTACADGLCCTPPGSAFSYNSFCCPGAARWSATGKCCYLAGMSASAASQCCSGRMVGHTCAPATEPGCLPKCKNDAFEHWKSTKVLCRSTACEEMAAASKHLHMAWCYAARLPRKC
eukprot:gene12110-12249_t